MSRDDEAKGNEAKLQWRDYLAIAIASLQTVLLPMVLLLVVILAFAILLGMFFGR